MITPLDKDSQPVVELPSVAYLQSPLLEFIQLPPYFCEATLNGLQAVEATKIKETIVKKEIRVEKAYI